MDAQALQFINKADRQYLSALNKRIASGEIHLIPLVKEQLVLTGQSTLKLNKAAG